MLSWALAMEVMSMDCNSLVAEGMVSQQHDTKRTVLSLVPAMDLHYPLPLDQPNAVSWRMHSRQ